MESASGAYPVWVCWLAIGSILALVPLTITFGRKISPWIIPGLMVAMLGFGVLSRLASGWISDRIGGLRTLLLGATLQALALAFFLPADGLVSLYVVSGLFGMFQGGIVPSYAMIVREHFSPREAGQRVGTVLMATLFGMALGGWMSGAIFDATGSYQAAFVNGIGWNLVTIVIALELIRRSRRTLVPA